MASKTPIRSTTTPLSNSIFKSKLIFLHEWWLMKPPNQCKGLALAGIASMERERLFFSSVIVKQHEPNVVETDDGITIMFRGLINASRTLQNGFPSEVCRRFSVGFPHNWKNYSAYSSGNECEYVDKVTGFDDSNTSSHKKTADETSQEAEGNDNIARLRLSQPHGDVIYNGENGFSNVDDSNASSHKKAADKTSLEVLEAEGNDNIASLRLSLPHGDVIYNGEHGFSNVDDSNASSHKKAADKTSLEVLEAEGNDNIASLRLSLPHGDVIYNGEHGFSNVDDSNASSHKKAADKTSLEVLEAEGNDNIASLKLSQPLVDATYNGENGVSSVAAAESNRSLMGVFEFDPTHEQDSVRSPLYAKKLEFDQLSSDRKDKKRIKKKIVEDTGNLCSRVLTRSISKKSRMMLKKDGNTEVKCFSSPVRRSTRVLNYKK